MDKIDLNIEEKLMQEYENSGIDIFHGTSFGEQATYFYIKQIFADSINGDRKILNSHKELDIYIPSLKTAIEYDGCFWHKDISSDRDIDKYNECKENGIKLIRIKELPCDEINNADEIYTYDCTDYSNLNLVISKIIRSLYNGNYIYKNEFEIPNGKYIDVMRDEIKIREKYIRNRIENSFAYVCPDKAEEWYYPKNGKLKPEFFSPFSRANVWWKCKYCGKIWNESIITHYNTHCGCFDCNTIRINEVVNNNEISIFQCDDTKVLKYWKSINAIYRSLNISQISVRKAMKLNEKFAGYYWISAEDFFTKHPEYLDNYIYLYQAIDQCDMNRKVIKTWESIKEASQELNISEKKILDCCNWDIVSVCGYKWKFNFEDSFDYTIDRSNYKSIKPIYLCDYDLNILKEYKSIRDAAKDLGINPGDISACLRGAVKSIHDYKFKYVNDEDDKGLESNYEKITGNEILQLDMNGKLISKWKNARQAALSLGYDVREIRFCVRGLRKSYHDCIWEYAAKDDCRGVKLVKQKKIIQYDLNGNEIKVWNSMTQAAKDLNLNRNYISDAIAGVRDNYAGYKWQYSDEDNKPRNGIYQCDLDGNIIKEFRDISSAAASTGLDSDKISFCARGLRDQYKGYKWKYVNESANKDMSIHKGKAVYKCDLNGNILEEYDNITIAGEKNQCDADKIALCAKGYKDSYRDFKWKFVNGQTKRNVELKGSGKAILQCDLDGNIIKKWNSISEAACSLGTNREQIRRVLVGQRKTCYGYKWRVAEDN